MTAPGQRRHNATGRSSGRLKQHSKSKLEGPFVAHTRELLASPVWGVLTLADRRVLDRLELEHMAHGGTENGNLKCTYSDFQQFGIRRASIAKALRRVEALGLIETIERGRIARGEFRFPAIYRVTYLGGNIPATHEWKRFSTMDDVQRVLAKMDLKNKKRGAKVLPLPDAKTLPQRAIPRRANATPVPGANSLPHYISWEDRPACTTPAMTCPASLKGRGAEVHESASEPWQSAGNALASAGIFPIKAKGRKG